MQIPQIISSLKNHTSLRYVDSTLRQSCLQYLHSNSPQPNHHLNQQCINYINALQQQHDNLLEDVSKFIDLHLVFVTESKQEIESLIQEKDDHQKQWHDEQTELQACNAELSAKIESVYEELNCQEEQTRILHDKLEFKEMAIDQHHKEETERLTKYQHEFQRLSLSLQATYDALRTSQHKLSSANSFNLDLNRQNQHLRNTIHKMELEFASLKASIPAQIEVPKTYIESFASQDLEKEACIEPILALSQEKINLSQEESDEPQKLSNFNDILFLSSGGEMPLTFWQNSCEKFMRFDYGTNEKENQPQNEEIKGEKKEKENLKLRHGVDARASCKTETIEVREFVLAEAEGADERNPYFFYFLIICQNAKINSKQFERVASIDTRDQWSHLIKTRVPLHKWEKHVSSFLHRRLHHN